MSAARPLNALDARHYLLSVQLQRSKIASGAQYPFNLPAIRNLDRLELHPAVTFLVGENGSGKSTLLEAIAVAWGLNPEGGSRNFRFGTRTSHSELHRYLKLVRGTRRPRDAFFLRAESFFNVATEIERLDQGVYLGPPVIDAYGGASLHEQSHGESFMTLVWKRFRGNGLYLLDEPEAALSPTRQLALLARIHQLVQANSQFIIATHSPLLLACPNARILSFEPDRMREVKYEETEHFVVTRRFLQDHHSMLRELLADDDSATPQD